MRTVGSEWSTTAAGKKGKKKRANKKNVDVQTWIQTHNANVDPDLLNKQRKGQRKRKKKTKQKRRIKKKAAQGMV